MEGVNAKEESKEKVYVKRRTDVFCKYRQYEQG